jgi:hypothetical protein
MRSGHLEEAREHARMAVALAAGTPLLEARAYSVLAPTELYLGLLDEAATSAAAIERAARAADQPIDVAQGMMMQGYVRLFRDPEGALPVIDAAADLALAHLPGGVSAAVYALAQAGLLRARRQDRAAMAHDLERALHLSAAEGLQEEYAIVLAATAVSLESLGDSETAATLLAAAETVYDATNLYRPFGLDREEVREQLASALGEDAFAAAWDRGATMSDRDALDLALAAVRAAAASAA